MMPTKQVQRALPEEELPSRLRKLAGAIPVVLVVFFAEWMVMHFLEKIVPQTAPHWVRDVTDATLVTVIMSLAAWSLFIRPLREALLHQSSITQAILTTANEGVVTIKASGRIESVNPSAERMFGYDPGELLGRNVAIMMPKLARSEHNAHFGRYLRGGDALVIGRQTEVIGQRKDGSQFPIEISVTEIPGGARRQFAGILRDISERRAAEQQIRELAHSDVLTGLANRALFIERVKQALSLARREHHQLALLYLDLDRFKAVNDTLGHDAGDELLRDVAARMGEQVRESDTVARLGGDEFTVLLPRINTTADAEEVARKLIEAIRAPYCLGSEQREACVGASVGIAIYPADGTSVDELLKAGDRAMYCAKVLGNTYRFTVRTPPAVAPNDTDAEIETPTLPTTSEI